VKGKSSVAVSLGVDSRSKASLEGWIVCTRWSEYRYNAERYITHMRAAKVGGPEGILADTWYELDAAGDFVAVKDDE
jgi:hypothetical protein